MPSIGSSSILRNLVIGTSTYITGPTGPTGPTGATGLSLTGPTGPTGNKFESVLLNGSTLEVYYDDDSVFYLSVTGPSGSGNRQSNPNFTVSFTGGSEFANPFAGICLSDPYLLLFKTVKLSGEVTGGISFDSFYIFSVEKPGATVGPIGSFLYVDENDASKITPTTDNNNKYSRSIITPVAGSNYGITLDTVSLKFSQDYTTEFGNNQLFNLNWYNTTKTNIKNYLGSVDVSYSILQGISGQFNRSDKSIFIFAKDEDGNIYPKLSFIAEGITLYSSLIGVTGPTGTIKVNIDGKGITYSELTYASSRLGSCCYCSTDQTQNTQSIVQRNCLDYTTKEFCDSVRGNFSFKSCTNRYLSGDCYSGGSCCVNGTCLETNADLCAKVYGTFYSNVKCSELVDGCPNTCSVDASCCVEGNCYSLPSGESSERICRELNGKYAEQPCEDRNCCLDGFLGACCFGSTECKDDYTPQQCAEQNGFYQGAGSICSSSICCQDTTIQPNNTNFQTQASREIASSLKVGDYFEGGIVAGFVGYPPPNQLTEDLYFAKGEIISQIENYSNSPISRYVAVNGVYNGSLKCNCSNFSPSRYITLEDLAKSNGKAVASYVKSLSGVNDELNLTFYNRLSDACLNDDGKLCNFKSINNKKFGFNPVYAYKKHAQQIHGDQIPSAWILIVSPEDFSSENLSFGMSMSVNGYNVPEEFNEYKDSLWQDMVLTPYGTSVFDGLLNTRLYDETTIERNTWFISSNYTLNGKLQNIDPLAYYRFKHSKFNYWTADIDENLMTKNPQYFKEKYKEMWKNVNKETTALYQISNKNKIGYNGYSDWYIPSALELNIIYYNLNKINEGLIYNAQSGWRTLSTTAKYWSSTTGGKLVNTKNYISGNSGIKTYEQYDYNLEGIVTSTDPQVDSWRKYKLTQAHRAYAQNFASGRMESILKTTRGARLRACRMIPIYFKGNNLENQFEYSYKILNSCTTCR